MNEEGGAGPLDEKTQRLVKLAVALAASTIGLPASVAVWTWIRDQGTPPSPKKARR